jgi:uncharacterized protein (DUF1330 family)
VPFRVSGKGLNQAKSWYNSPAQQEINAMAENALKQRWYVVDTAM